jgi:hypothetical protein
MKEIDKIKENYSIALDNYRTNNPVLHDADYRKIHICSLCSAKVQQNALKDHMATHETLPPKGLTYQLTLPFHIVNGLISRGAKFVKMICIFWNEPPFEGFEEDRFLSVPFNAMNLPDGFQLTDTENIKIYWSANQKCFLHIDFLKKIIPK